LSFDADWVPAGTVAIPAASYVAPTQCRTSSYTAGAGEFAVVMFQGTVQITPAASDVFYTDVLMSQNGAAFTVATTNSAVAPVDLNSGAAHVGISKRIPLVAGTTYVFAAGFAMNAAQTATAGLCHGVVMITK
jgi:hypothetical protein